MEHPEEPRPGERPVAIRSGAGDSENLSSFDDRESGEEAEFDELRLLRSLIGQPVQRVVERKQVHRRRQSHQGIGFDLRPRVTSAVLEAASSPRPLDQNASHGLRRGAEEVRPVAEAGDGATRRLVRAGQAHPRLVDQSRRVHGPSALTAKLARGDATQLGVERGDQRIVRSGVAGSKRIEKSRDIRHALQTIP